MKKTINNLFTAQFLGVLNDNLLKNLICFVSIYWAPEESKSSIIAAASATMVLPFILLSPLAGHLSQKHQKSRIFQIAKLAEIPIMLIAFTGFISNSLHIVLFSMLLMGIQSCLYSPAKYGMVKELSDGNNLPKQLGIMEMLSFTAVLSGALLAGLVADLNKFQLTITGSMLLIIALLGWLSSKKVDVPQIINTTIPVKQFNPLTFLKNNFNTAKRYKGVNLSILGLATFWLIGSLLQMNLLIHCPDALGMTNSQTGLITAFVAVGIGLGCWVSGIITRNRLEMGTIVFAGLGLALSTYLLSFQLNTPLFITTLMFAAFCGGLFKIPLNAWIQQRTDNKDLGNMLAYSNMVVFLFILLSAGLFALLQLNFNTYAIFKLIAGIALLTSVVTCIKIPVATLRVVVLAMTKVIYNLSIQGKENIPLKTGGILAVNHVSLLDSLLIITAAPRNIRFVMHENVFNMPVLGRFFKKLNMIPIQPGKGKEALQAFTDRCKQEIENGHIICIFPEGQLSRNGKLLPFKKGIEHLSASIQAPVIPMHMDGLTGTPLSYKTGSSKRFGFAPKNIRKKVFITIGQALNAPINSFELRQTIKELEVNNSYNRFGLLTEIEAANKAKKQVFKNAQEITPIHELSLNTLVINTPDYTVKNVTGGATLLTGTKENTVGQPLPGVTVQIVNDNFETLLPNQIGMILLKHGFSNNLNWINTNAFGYLDEDGFLTITSNK